MKEVNGNKIGIWDGIAYIICDDIGKTIIKVANGKNTDSFLSLNDCLDKIDYDGYGVVTVIIEEPTSGKVYRYNNYNDKKWYNHGTTNGYA